MKLRNILIAGLLAVASMAQAQMGMMTPLPLDKDTRVGTLDNGLTYYIRHNEWPEHRANFYIAQKVGSIQEEESQRGLAHFLEHMCFNGTRHFPGNEVMRWCESIGVQFGGDLNAYTSIDQTVYNIDNVPTTRQSAIDSCLLILADWAGDLTLDPKEIDEERGVIHEEWRLRTSAQSRMLERNLPALYPNSKYGERYPIGLMSVIDNFKYQELRDYYEKWYHPSNQGIIVVGDVDVDQIENKIKQLFGSYTNPANAEPIVSVEVPDNAEPIVIIDKDKEMQYNFVELMVKSDCFPDSLRNTMAFLFQNYVTQAATSMLSQRLTEVSQNADCPFTQAGADYGQYIFAKTKDAFDLSILPKDPSLTAEALKAAYTEARRAAQFGFTATEYKRFQDDFLSSLEKQYTNRDKRTNQQFYAACRQNFLSGDAMLDIDTYYQLMKQVVPMLPVDMVNELMAELVPDNDSNLVVLNFNTEHEGSTYPTRESLINAVHEARAAEVTAYVDNVKNEPLITSLPKAGKIVKETTDPVLGYTTLTLSNGATVILKQTDYKKDQVLLTAAGTGAETLYGPKDYTNLQVFDDVIAASGLGSFSSTELSKALAGKIANVDLSMGRFYTSADGSSTPKDLETMMQMLYLYFTNIAKDQKSFDNLMSQYQTTLKNRALSPDIALSDSINATLYGHNPRLEPLTTERLGDINYDRILEIAKERTANAADWSFTFIGNFDTDSIRPLICRYIASLPADKKHLTQMGPRSLIMADGVINNFFERKQETPKCTAYMYWHSDNMPFTLENAVRADMAGQVLSMIYLKKIREEASAAYSVGASGMSNILGDGSPVSILFAYCPMKPEKKDEALRIMNEEADAMAKTVDADMLAKVKEFMLKSFDDNVKTNNFWESLIWRYRVFGVDTYTNYRATVEAQTPETVAAFMKELLSADNHITVMLLPESEK